MLEGNTTILHAEPLILTLDMDAASAEALDALRQAHFPPARNFIPAHLTLFHALPGAEEAAICALLEATCAATPPCALGFEGLRFLGRGVAVHVVAPALLQLRQQLAQDWAPWLSAQDSQRYQPHVTIQNKVAPAQARQLFTELGARWQPWQGRGEGLLLWRYLGGPWEELRSWRFAAQAV